MIHTASYFQPAHHHGQLFAISRGVPKGFKGDRLPFFELTKDLLQWWKANAAHENWPQYQREYRQILADRKDQIFDWLDSLSPFRPLPHMTLLCWEHDDLHCHRRLVMERVIQKYRPQLAGGRDVPQIQVGDHVEWVGMPTYLEFLCPLQVRTVERDTVFCRWIETAILKSEIRRT